MKIIHKLSALFLSALILLPALSAPADAAAPSVTTNEAMYVNLDYYGKVSKVNIVKSCALNGNRTIKDYGSYQTVTNMSNSATPKVTSSGVEWTLPESTGSFYYDCTPKSNITLPWSFDVSYKLNGVPADAKKLAGVSGTVEMDIKVTPNQSVADYYKNDMILAVGTYVSMDKTLSLEAPGAQIMSLGQSKVAMFAALPGEEDTFVIRIGTKEFETSGIIMMMVPGTMSQMDDIKDLKDVKDKAEDSLDGIVDSTNQLMDAIASLSGGLSQVQSGLTSMDKVRRNISNSGDGLEQNADKSLKDLQSVADETEKLVPRLESAKTTVDDLLTKTNSLMRDMTDVKPYVSSLQSSIGQIRIDLNDLRDVLEDAGDSSDDRDSLMSSLESDVKGLKTGSKQMSSLLDSLHSNMKDLNDMLKQIESSLSSSSGSSDPDTQMMAALLPKLTDTIDSTNDLISAVSTMTGESDGFADQVLDGIDLLNSTFSLMDDAGDSADDLLKDAKKAAGTLESLLGSGETILDDMSSLNDTIEKNKSGVKALLQNAEDLTKQLTSLLKSTHDFLSAFQSIVDTSKSDLDQGTRDSLNGLIDVMQKGLDNIGVASTIKNATNTVKSALDKEIDKYETDSNLLNLDTSAQPVSFTSSKNPSPESVQIILRTAEISVDDNGSKDTEPLEQEVSPFKRMCQVFEKIWQAVVSAFSDL